MATLRTWSAFKHPTVAGVPQFTVYVPGVPEAPAEMLNVTAAQLRSLVFSSVIVNWSIPAPMLAVVSQFPAVTPSALSDSASPPVALTANVSGISGVFSLLLITMSWRGAVLITGVVVEPLSSKSIW